MLLMPLRTVLTKSLNLEAATERDPFGIRVKVFTNGDKSESWLLVSIAMLMSESFVSGTDQFAERESVHLFFVGPWLLKFPLAESVMIWLHVLHLPFAGKFEDDKGQT